MRIWSVLLFSAAAAYAGSTPPFTSGPFPFSGVPNSVTLGSDGNIWLIDRAANKVGRLTSGGAYTTFAIPTANAIASGITLGPDGNCWFAEFGPNPNKIARVTPDGAITEFALPAGKSLGSIAAGPDGNVWFTESVSSNGPPLYSLGRISTADQSMADFALPPNGRAQGLVSGADGNLWIGWVESSGTKYDVLRVTPAGSATTFALPATGASNALGATMLLGPDLNIWFTYQNNLARVKPDGTATLYPIPTANSNMLPAGLTIGLDSNIWFTEFSSGKLGQLIVNSATDGGQASINESDSFGGLPQAIFPLPGAPPRSSGKTAFILPPGGKCGDIAFVIQSQPATTSPSQLMVLQAPRPAQCADVVLNIEGTTFMFFGPSYPYLEAARVTNNGPDDANQVRATFEIYTGSSGMNIDQVQPAKFNGDRFVIDGQCDPIKRGPAGASYIVNCSWPQLKDGDSRTVYFAPRPPTSLKDYRGTWWGGAYANDPFDPNIKNNFKYVRFGMDGSAVESVPLEPVIRGTVSILRRGH